MARFSIVLICVALAAGCLAEKVQNLHATVEFIDDISEFLADNSDVELIPLDGIVQPIGQIRYTLGRRVVGDRIVAQGNNNFNYPTLQDVRINLNYPTNGMGAVVSYVEIVVDQSSSDGKAYIVGGGIGQRAINIVVEARRTSRLSYRAAIYGY